MPVVVNVVEDIAAIRADLARVYQDFPGHDAEGCLAAIEAALAAGGPQACFYSGFFNGRHIAGVLACGSTEARELSWLAVRSGTRGRGVGRRLLAEAIRLERNAGAGAITLRLPAEADAAITSRALAAAGFRPLPDGQGWRIPPAAG